MPETHRLEGYPLPDDASEPVRGASVPAPGVALGNHFDGCFACGADHPDGLHLTAIAGEGVSVTTHARITGAHQGAPGLAHGGILAAVLDESLGFLLWMLETAGVTAKLEVQYRAPVPIDSDVHGAARCTGVAGRKIYSYASLHLGAPDGPVVAEASGLFVAVDESHFAPYVRGVGGEQVREWRERMDTRLTKYNP